MSGSNRVPMRRRAEGIRVQELRNVLAATDLSAASKQGAVRAARIASAHGARLTLLHVVEQDWIVAARSVASGRDFQAAVEEQCRIQLSVLADELAGEVGIRAEPVLRTGSPVQQLRQAAEGADLVVVAAGGASHPLRDATLGSTAARLARLATRPILVVRTAAQDHYRRVLVATDFSEASPDGLRAAMRLAPEAAMELVHCFELAYEGRLRLAGAADADLERYRNQSRAVAEREARELLQRAQAPAGARVSVRQGDARFELLSAAKEHRADLLVVGKQGRSFLADTLLGSVSSWLLAEAPCDVLVVPPR